ncbi:unnamed protein product [Cyprideis torosa]|uniref:Uncharacterized protein n=1 Tax=Cyprideis torosa TaxID=163714 RepID=A0A7R8WD28_9CRUS|nr:unnamed protein product [Cyprideis torosa]CAG0894202.1 unnamed protein product [Cyprideis torosa]
MGAAVIEDSRNTDEVVVEGVNGRIRRWRRCNSLHSPEDRQASSRPHASALRRHSVVSLGASTCLGEELAKNARRRSITKHGRLARLRNRYSSVVIPRGGGDDEDVLPANEAGPVFEEYGIGYGPPPSLVHLDFHSKERGCTDPFFLTVAFAFFAILGQKPLKATLRHIDAGMAGIRGNAEAFEGLLPPYSQIPKLAVPVCVPIGYVIFTDAIDFQRFFHGADSFGNVCGQENTKIGQTTLEGKNMTLKPYLFYFDPMYPNVSLRVCVEKCPRDNMDNFDQVLTWIEQSDSLMCRYDVTKTDVEKMAELEVPKEESPEDEEQRKEGEPSLLPACPEFPIQATEPVGFRCIPVTIDDRKPVPRNVSLNVPWFLGTQNILGFIVSEMYRYGEDLLPVTLFAIGACLFHLISFAAIPAFSYMVYALLLILSVGCTWRACLFHLISFAAIPAFSYMVYALLLILSVGCTWQDQDSLHWLSTYHTYYMAGCAVLFAALSFRVSFAVVSEWEKLVPQTRLLNEVHACFNRRPWILAFSIPFALGSLTVFFLGLFALVVAHVAIGPEMEARAGEILGREDASIVLTTVEYTRKFVVPEYWLVIPVAMVLLITTYCNAYLIYISDCVSEWYFTKEKFQLARSQTRALFRTGFYHMGSAALSAVYNMNFLQLNVIANYIPPWFPGRSAILGPFLKLSECLGSRCGLVLIGIQGNSLGPSSRKARALRKKYEAEWKFISHGLNLIMIQRTLLISVTVGWAVLQFTWDANNLDRFLFFPLPISFILALWIGRTIFSLYEGAYLSMFFCYCLEREGDGKAVESWSPLSFFELMEDAVLRNKEKQLYKASLANQGIGTYPEL